LKTNARLYVAYDNFQYYQRVGAQRLGQFDELRQYTADKLQTSLMMDCIRICLFNKHVKLKASGIICAEGNQHDESQNQISRSFIAKAISQAYPTSVDHVDVFNSKRADIYSFPKMPEIDILPPEVTPSTTLGPITAEEGSIDITKCLKTSFFVSFPLIRRRTSPPGFLPSMMTNRLPLVSGQFNLSAMRRSPHTIAIIG
jgi:hypothetical protein